MTVIGFATSTCGSRSALRIWRRWRCWTATTRLPRGRPRFSEVTPGPIGSIPTETTSWAQSAVLLHLPRIHLDRQLLAAAALLRAGGRLDDATADDVSRVADEAANLIGDFDEGFSNRQTWNNAALAAIAGWFEDEDLAKRAIEGPTGCSSTCCAASDVTGCGTRERTTISSRCGAS